MILNSQAVLGGPCRSQRTRIVSRGMPRPKTSQSSSWKVHSCLIPRDSANRFIRWILFLKGVEEILHRVLKISSPLPIELSKRLWCPGSLAAIGGHVKSFWPMRCELELLLGNQFPGSCFLPSCLTSRGGGGSLLLSFNRASYGPLLSASMGLLKLLNFLFCVCFLNLFLIEGWGHQ